MLIDLYDTSIKLTMYCMQYFVKQSERKPLYA